MRQIQRLLWITTDGWLHTGDMGVIDSDGVITIKGRCKTMILSASGQNIYPEQIEERLNNMYLVAESLIIENGNSLVALVVPDYELATAEGVSKDKIKTIMEQNLRDLNTQVGSYEKLVRSRSTLPSSRKRQSEASRDTSMIVRCYQH